jgi:pectinesterase
VLGYLAQAGNVTAPTKDDWDPTAGVGDTSGVTPNFEVEDGGTHETVQSAVDAAVTAGGTERVLIRVAAGTYREVVCVPSGAPPITLYGAGDSPDDTVIVFDNYNGKAKEAGEPANPCNPNLSGTTFGTSGSATFAAYASGFQAKNLTIANDTEEAGLSTGTQAVALMTQGDKIVLDGVRLLANQDTLYTKTSDPGLIQRVYIKGSYIEGDVDFIFGRATLVLDACTIHYLTARQGTKGGYLVAPSTDSRNPFGILINASELTAEEGTPASLIFLGRAWDESQTDLPTYAANIATGVYPNGQVVIRDSTLGAHVSSVTPWGPSTIKRSYSSVPTTYPANRFFEFANDGPGSAAP